MSGGGGGGSPEVQQPTVPVAPPPPPPPPWAKLGVNTEQGYNTLMQTQDPNATPAMKGQAYNQLLSQGFNDAAIRSSADTLFGTQSGADWNSLVQQGGMQSGRPLPGSAQFYQPQYQPQYQNYGFGNPFSISQYGQQPTMQTPFSMFGGQMQGGGYGMYGMNNPFSPYSNTFLNAPVNLNRMGQADKVGFYQNAMDRGFNDQQVYNQTSGLFGYQSPQDWSYLQNQAMQMQSPFRSSGPTQPIVSRSAQMRGTPNVMRRAEGGIASLVGDE